MRRRSFDIAGLSLALAAAAVGCRYGDKAPPPAKAHAPAAEASLKPGAIESQEEIFRVYQSRRDLLPRSVQDLLAKHITLPADDLPAIVAAEAAPTATDDELRTSLGHESPQLDLPQRTDRATPLASATLPATAAAQPAAAAVQRTFRDLDAGAAAPRGMVESNQANRTAGSRVESAQPLKPPTFRESAPEPVQTLQEVPVANPLARKDSAERGAGKAIADPRSRGMLSRVISTSKRELQTYSFYGEALIISIIIIGFATIAWIRLEYDHRRELIRSRAVNRRNGTGANGISPPPI